MSTGTYLRNGDFTSPFARTPSFPRENGMDPRFREGDN
jgi:hypothetical protein